MTSRRVISHSEHVMGTVVSYRLDPGPLSVTEARAAISDSVEVLHRADQVFSTWSSQSPMSRFRAGELDWSELPPEIPEVLGLCTTAKRLSQGLFDPWALDGGVDPTGLVKGWAIDKALDVLVARGIAGAVVNGGGDMAIHGSENRQTLWRVGIRHPWRPDALAAVIEMPGGSAVATSGRYERGDHLVDPFGHSTDVGARTVVVSATVTGPVLAMADAFATALAVAGSRARALVGGLGQGYGAYWILADGSEEATAGFPFVGDPEPVGQTSSQ
ncbi:MAG: FAD:protein FMN transferase [Acidimicrobiales bacterium]